MLCVFYYTLNFFSLFYQLRAMKIYFFFIGRSGRNTKYDAQGMDRKLNNFRHKRKDFWVEVNG